MDSLVNIFTQEIAKEQISMFLILASFAGGILSSLSPCTLGLLPLVIGYVGGYSKHNHLKLFIQLSSFIFGLAIVLTTIGVICAVSGQILASVANEYWVLFLASVIMVFGLDLLGIIEINFPVLIKKMPQNKKNTLFVYPVLIGIAFALAASPCSTPFLASIMSVASLTKNIGFSALMLFLFSLGQGVVIILVGMFISSVKKLTKFAKLSAALMKISGLLLVIAAVFIYFKVFQRFFV